MASVNDGDPFGGALGEARTAVFDAARGVTERFDRAYWLDCARTDRFPDEMWTAMAEQGLLGLGVPEEYGGSGGGITEVTAAMEATSAAGTPLALYLLTAFSRECILRHGSPEQCKRFVEPTASGAERICFAITGEVADKRLGLSLFVVDVDTPGLTYQPIDIGIVMPDRQFTVFFDDVELGEDRLVGEAGEGFRYLFDALNPERVVAAAWGIGLGDFALEKAVAYARERAPFGTPIGSYQALQHPLAQAKADLDAARLAMYTACRVFDSGGNAGYLANAAKLLASQAATRACDAAIQTHGGYAFNDEYDIATIWPNVRLLQIAPLNNEMILNYIAEHVLRLPRSY
jgi:acyl-CoA dehydrogenase